MRANLPGVLSGSFCCQPEAVDGGLDAEVPAIAGHVQVAGEGFKLGSFAGEQIKLGFVFGPAGSYCAPEEGELFGCHGFMMRFRCYSSNGLNVLFCPYVLPPVKH